MEFALLRGETSEVGEAEIGRDSRHECVVWLDSVPTDTPRELTAGQCRPPNSVDVTAML